jgi:tetratricopeptide (TPR) repeat protein
MMSTAPTAFTIGGAIGFLYKDMRKLRLAAALLLLTCAAQGWAEESLLNRDFRLCDNATQSPAEAISACTRILNLKPAGRDFSLAWSNRGAAWYTQGDLDKAIADFTEAIKTNAKLIIAYKNRAAAWLSKNEFDRAINDYTTVIRLDPKSAAAYIDRANALTKKGDLDRAIADLDKAIELAPKSPAGYLIRALLLQSQNNFDGLQDITEASRLAPENAAAYDMRAWFYVAKEDYGQAIADYTQAIRLEPKNWRFHARRAEAYRIKGAFDLALQDYENAFDAAPDAANLPELYNARGLVWRDKGDYERALSDFGEAILRNPNYSFPYINRGDIWFLKKDIAKALADFNKALAITPHVIAYAYRGRAWLALEDRGRAFADFREALRVSPNDISALEGRGEAYEQSGDRVSARADYERALSIPRDKNPASDWPAQARARGRLEGLKQQEAKAAEEEARRVQEAKAAQETRRVQEAKAAEERALQPESKRIALVIGNSNYALAPLDTPKNDADDISAALRRLHFDVAERTDISVRDFDQAMDTFEAKAKDADVALFFFSGHGVQIDKRGYLAPIDVNLESESSALRGLESVQEVVSRIENSAKVSIIVIDACRNSPLQDHLRRIAMAKNRALLGPQGLPPVSVVGSNTLIVYATVPGESALDGEGRNSPFSGALLRHIETPGLEIELMFKRVTSDVLRATGGKQQPERLSRLQNELVLLPAMSGAMVQATPSADMQAWIAVQSTTSQAVLEEFVRQYSSSTFAGFAKARLDELKKERSPEPSRRTKGQKVQGGRH